MKGTTFEDSPLPVKMLTAGTAACLADLVTFPLDTSKVRLQIQGEGKGVSGVQPRYRGVFSTIATMCREEGPKSLYNGLSAGLQRQMCFASVRIGMYDSVKNFYQSLISGGKKKEEGLDVLSRICAGVTTGALAVAFAQPTDVVKVRFQALRSNEQRYRSTTEAYKTIYKLEGVRGLWKGAYPNVGRNAIVNVSEIVCYDLVKDIILRKGLLEDNITCHFLSAVAAGFFATVVSSPVDVIKTRYMNSRPGTYRSAIHCAIQTGKQEGFWAFYKGWCFPLTDLCKQNTSPDDKTCKQILLQTRQTTLPATDGTATPQAFRKSVVIQMRHVPATLTDKAGSHRRFIDYCLGTLSCGFPSKN